VLFLAADDNEAGRVLKGLDRPGLASKHHRLFWGDSWVAPRRAWTPAEEVADGRIGARAADRRSAGAARQRQRLPGGGRFCGYLPDAPGFVGLEAPDHVQRQSMKRLLDTPTVS
jgi:hypothetical protein